MIPCILRARNNSRSLQNHTSHPHRSVYLKTPGNSKKNGTRNGPVCFAHERLLLYVDVHLALFFNGVFHGYA